MSRGYATGTMATESCSLEVPVNLPIGERLKLRAIERAETSADPVLAARFSIFGRLSRHEDMPRTERLKAREIRRKKWAEGAIAAYVIRDLGLS